MRSLILGLIGLPLAACTLRINAATDGASASDSGMSSTSTSSTGALPTTSDAQGTSEAGTDAVSTGPASTGVVSTSEATSTSGAPSTTGNSSASPSTGEPETDGTTAGTSGGLDMGGAPSTDATVVGSCAPDDGPALEFRLLLAAPVCGADWSGVTLRVMLFQGGPLAPGDYTLDGGKGFAWVQEEGQPEEVSTDGTITIDGWDGDVVTGSYSLAFEGFVIDGEFAGPTCPGGVVCG